MDFSPETLRAQFAALTGQHDAIDGELAPLRAELDALVAGDTALTVRQAHEREAGLRAAIKALQEQMFPIEQERAAMCRALGGKTSAPDVVAG
jgi:hypothetical protein